jgi:aminoglycoside phosphotransferase (APT) family kinase protein
MTGVETAANDPSRLAKIAEGRQAEIFAWSSGEVLRLYRDPNAHEMADREMVALEAVRSKLPSVPAAISRLDWEGRPGLLLERLDGRGLLAEMQRRPWRSWTLAALTGRLHGDLNAVRGPVELPDLRRELRGRIEAEPSVPTELREAALEELERLPDGDALCHGDFHPENVLLSQAGPIVIDWPHATRGDPCGDFARTVLMLRAGALPPGTPGLIRLAQSIGRGLFLRGYVGGYETRRRYDAEMIRRWQFVRAVDRFADRIPEEREPLLREAERLYQGIRR